MRKLQVRLLPPQLGGTTDGQTFRFVGSSWVHQFVGNGKSEIDVQVS